MTEKETLDLPWTGFKSVTTRFLAELSTKPTRHGWLNPRYTCDKQAKNRVVGGGNGGYHT